MIVTGSTHYKDKRVDKLLAKKGFTNSEIFYSPIKIWLVVLFSLLIIGFSLLLPFVYYNSIWILGYVFIGYCICVLLNRSFAICDDQLLIINSHFPSKSVTKFQLSNIQKITIASNKKLCFLILFGFHYNYIEIKTIHKTKRFYCLFLDVDCYDENWTAKTLDSLDVSLREKNVNVVCEI